MCRQHGILERLYKPGGIGPSPVIFLAALAPSALRFVLSFPHLLNRFCAVPIAGGGVTFVCCT